MPDDVNARLMAGPFAPLARKPFRFLWLGMQAMTFGQLMQAVAAAWMMTVMTNSASMVAMVQVAATLPLVLFSLPAGAAADSFDRSKIMLTAQFLLLSSSLLLAAFAWSGMLTPGLLLVLTFLVGCGTALNQPTWQASVGDLLSRDELAAGVTLNALGYASARSVAPAVGGVMVGAFGVMTTFVATAFLYLPAIAVLLRWRPPRNPNALPPESLGSAISSGVRYFAMSPSLERLSLRGMLFGCGSAAVPALLPFLAKDQLQGGASTYGVLLGAFGIGSVASAFVSARLRNMLSAEQQIRIVMSVFALSALVIAFSLSLILTGACLMVCGACWTLVFSRLNVALQFSSSRWVVGRALAIHQTLIFGGGTLGAWLWGTIAEAHGISTSITLASAFMLFSAAVGLVYPLSPGTADFDPLNLFREPQLALDINPRSGPIRIAVQYMIREEDIDAFLQIMEERKRIRRRDGARHWTLARDLERPEIWVETFHCSTWLDYIRFSRRITKADEEVLKRVRALNAGGESPIVRRFIERPTIRYDLIPPKSPIDMQP